MFDTVEMRWFFDTPPLDDTCHFHQHTEIQERTDWYSMPCNPLCGIKLREERLETKLRTAAFGLRTLRPLVGHLEAWRKWSLEFALGDHPCERELRDAGWSAVDKRRQLRRFEVRQTEVHPTTVRPTSGCEFEMTELIVRGRTYWTVGFEAVGAADVLESNLRRVVEHVVEQGGIQRAFDAVHSYGYAHWLSQLNDT